MEWQHYNMLRAHLWHIEKLLQEMESSLYKKEGIYEHVEMDLTKEQIRLITENLALLYEILEKIQKDFNLENDPIDASKIMYMNTLFILQTINETWSSYIEKCCGKIDSIEEKKQIDEYLDEIVRYTKRIKEMANRDDLVP